MDPTPASTAVPSKVPSMDLSEKGDAEPALTPANASIRSTPSVKSKKEVELTPVQEAAALEKPVERQQDEIDHPKGLKLATVITALCLAVFLVALDNTIIATAIPRISDDFSAIEDIGWYGSSYLLTTCAFQLLWGKFYTFFSIKWTFLTAIGIFELGSLVCGVAPNSTALILGRAIAGLGSAGIFSGALIIIAYSVPLDRRPIYTGLIGGMYGIASVAGPLMGGAFTDRLTWRWCFYINLPIGAVTVLAIIIFFKSPKRQKEGSIGFMARFKQFDPIGTLFFLPAIICLLLALQWGGQKYPWNNGRIIALFILAGLLLIGFVVIQIWKGETATVPPRIFWRRSVIAGCYFGLCLGGAFFIFIYYLPIWFQAIKNTSATQSGIDNLPLILAQVISSIAAGVLTTVIGYYTPFMYMAVIFMAVGAGLLTTMSIGTGTGAWIGYQIIFGWGTGSGFQQPLLAAQTVLPLDDVPIGTATVMFIQILGGALFVAVAQNIFTNTLLKNVIATIPSIPPNLIIQNGATKIREIPGISGDNLDQLLIAYNGALSKTFQVALILACISIFGAVAMEWRSVKAKKIEAVAA